MQLNLSTDIALRTLIYLGQKNAPATIAEIAEAFDIVKTHLMKVVMMLVAANLVSSERGRNGGIRLARAANEIRIGEVVQVMEPGMALVFCMKEDASDDDCPLLPSCKLRKVFVKAQKSLLATLNETTLADLLGSKTQALIK
ncbi:RrF2 family transcriptional regulator [Ferrigenium sp. UT5]|uniref:RrF2 family transcriptional regulator n=1 Tax=Ferrigenium sp. UT5 TaxID=3242105 RepID=UPI003550205C